MCGRFNIGDPESVEKQLETLGVDPIKISPRYNIAPTSPVPVVIEEEGRRQLHEMRWWLTPSWSKEINTKYSMFNARSENLNTSRAFKGPYRHHRGIIPATSFIEWKTEQQKKQPYLIKPKRGVLALACIFDVWEHDSSYIESCAIVTRRSPESFQAVHDRFPVILAHDQIDLWLDTKREIEAIKPIFNAPFKRAFEISKLDSQVNRSSFQGIEAEQPIDEPKIIMS